MVFLRLFVHLVLVRPVLRLFFGVNVRGRENLEGLDQVILIANHNSHLDVLLLFSLLPWRLVSMTHPVAAQEYFEQSRITFFIINLLLEPVWIDRTAQHTKALERMEHLLETGHSIILFPEGTRGEPGRIQPFKSGVGRLVESNRKIPVVPVHILGPERSLPKGSSVPLPLWNHLTVGPPQRLTGPARDVTAALEESIRALTRTQVATRHQRPGPRRDCFSIAVLGIDGSGKSTLARALAGRLSAESMASLISDRLELYAAGTPALMQPLMAEMLRTWLGRQAKQAKSLASYKIPKLAEMLLRDRLIGESRRWYAPAWIIQDGSPLLNLTAWSTLYRQGPLDEAHCERALQLLAGQRGPARGEGVLREHPEMRVLRAVGIKHLCVPDAVVFIDILPRTAMNRITSRGERRQIHETEEKLAKLRAAYVLVCNAAERALEIPVLRIEGDNTASVAAEKALAFVASARGQERVA